MPLLEIEMFFIIGCVLGLLSGISVFASDEKADWNCLFKILSFSDSYWNYIENMIFDLEINEPDQQKFYEQPKNVYSYIKSHKKKRDPESLK
jgi:hypothetical protein